MYCAKVLIYLYEINIRPWDNKKTIKAKSPSNVFRAISFSDVFDQVYTEEIKTRGIPDERNIRKTLHPNKINLS